MDLDHRQCIMEFGVTWACSTVPLAVNILIALSNEAYSAKMCLEELKIRGIPVHLMSSRPCFKDLSKNNLNYYLNTIASPILPSEYG
jgi:hypothetical protein